jgi:hypothetical protein
MLELARQKGVYSQFICQRVEHTSNVARGTYDVVVTSGGMGEGHIPSAALADMAHITKTGVLRSLHTEIPRQMMFHLTLVTKFNLNLDLTLALAL